MSKAATPNPLRQFLGTLSGADQLRAEKSRLEAFLAAFPGDYCAFAHDGSVIYSKNFLQLLGLGHLATIEDIQNILNSNDAALLEGMYYQLQQTQKNFTLDVQINAQEKILNITGSAGQALEGRDIFYILWVKDVTEDSKKIKNIEQVTKQAKEETLRLENIMHALPHPLWMRDSHGDLTWCNKAYSEMAGDSPANIIARQKELLLTSKEKGKSKTSRDMAITALKENTPQESVNHITTGGKRRYVEVNEIPLNRPTENKFTIGMMRDISREEELNTELQRYVSANNTLLEQLRTAIALFGANQKLEFFNSSFSELWGLEDQWLNTHPPLSDILEKLRETRRLPEQADFRHYKKTWLDMFTRLIDPHDEMLYLPDGSALRLLVIPHPMGGLMMTFEDVTSRLELESSYNTLIAVQKETLDNLAEGVAVYGGDGRLKLCNPSFSDLWGLNPEDVEGEPHITTLVERMSPFFAEHKWEERKKMLISHGIERKTHEGRMARKDATLVEFATVPLPDGGVLVSYFDVTDAVKVENALREKNAALEAAEHLKTDFLANVSYQLRTPLNAIMGFAEILDNQYFGNLNDKQKEYSSGIQEAGQKLVRLIDDILDLSTIEAGYLDLNMAEFDVFETLKGLEDLTKEWARKQDIQVRIECDKSIGNLIADERRIKQVLLNLIHNAISFTPQKGSITISAARRKETMDIIVSDTGIGISKADLERVFEPFERIVIEHRADMSANALSRGAGLGLSLVKNIVELHEGHVAIESEEGKGTRVTLSLPLEPVLEPLL